MDRQKRREAGGGRRPRGKHTRTGAVVRVNEAARRREGSVDRVRASVRANGVADLERLCLPRRDDRTARLGGARAPVKRDWVDADLARVGRQDDALRVATRGGILACDERRRGREVGGLDERSRRRRDDRVALRLREPVERGDVCRRSRWRGRSRRERLELLKERGTDDPRVR